MCWNYCSQHFNPCVVAQTIGSSAWLIPFALRLPSSNPRSITKKLTFLADYSVVKYTMLYKELLSYCLNINTKGTSAIL